MPFDRHKPVSGPENGLAAVLGENGVYVWDRDQTATWDAYRDLYQTYSQIVVKWNRNVGDFNAKVAPEDIGRPLAASEAQQAEALKRRKAGESLRSIAATMALSLRTVRTIVERAEGTDRATKARREHRRIEFNRQRAAAFRARHKARERIPKEAGEMEKRGEKALMKAVKGLDDR